MRHTYAGVTNQIVCSEKLICLHVQIFVDA